MGCRGSRPTSINPFLACANPSPNSPTNLYSTTKSSAWTATVARRGEPYFYAFDVPFLDGRDLRELPLLERKRILREIVPLRDSRL